MTNNDNAKPPLTPLSSNTYVPYFSIMCWPALFDSQPPIADTAAVNQTRHNLKNMNPKNLRKKSPIHENVDANITCDFGDGDISRLGVAYLTHVTHVYMARRPHTHTHTRTHTHRRPGGQTDR